MSTNDPRAQIISATEAAIKLAEDAGVDRENFSDGINELYEEFAAMMCTSCGQAVDNSLQTSIVSSNPKAPFANDEGWRDRLIADLRRTRTPSEIDPEVVREARALSLLNAYHIARTDRECCGDEFEADYRAAERRCLDAMRCG